MSASIQNQPSPFLSSLTKESLEAAFLKLDSLPASDEPKIQKSNRCCAEGCKKKIGLLDIECRCGKKHCSLHRQAELHNCTYDFKKDGLRVLENQLGSAVIAKKLEKV